MAAVFTLKDLQIEEGTICDAPMNPRARVVMFKRQAAQGKDDDMSKTKTKKNAPGENLDPLKALGGLSEEEQAAIQQLISDKDEQIAQMQAKLDEQEKAAQKPDDNDVGKEGGEGEDGETKEANKSREISKAEREIAELRKQLAEERNRREERDFLEKAREFPSIPVKREKLASLMRGVSTLEKAHGETLEQVLRACNKLASTESAITKSLGKANGLEGGERSASEEIDEIAAGLMKSDPQLPRTKAIAKAWQSRPDLVEKARKETGGR